MLYSLQLALEQIKNKNVIVVTRDSVFNNPKRIEESISEMRALGIKVIIGPTSFEDFEEIRKYSDLIFLSPTNISPKFSGNIISIGVSLDSQLLALTKFIKKQSKTKTVIMYPKNDYMQFVEKKIESLNLKNVKTFSSPNQKFLPGKLKF